METRGPRPPSFVVKLRDPSFLGAEEVQGPRGVSPPGTSAGTKIFEQEVTEATEISEKDFHFPLLPPVQTFRRLPGLREELRGESISWCPAGKRSPPGTKLRSLLVVGILFH
jgi:hypothetical protein